MDRRKSCCLRGWPHFRACAKSSARAAQASRLHSLPVRPRSAPWRGRTRSAPPTARFASSPSSRAPLDAAVRSCTPAHERRRTGLERARNSHPPCCIEALATPLAGVSLSLICNEPPAGPGRRGAARRDARSRPGRGAVHRPDARGVGGRSTASAAPGGVRERPPGGGLRGASHRRPPPPRRNPR